MTQLFACEINLDNHPILSHHVLGGRPVVPLALMAEWLGHGALHQNPGLTFMGIDNLRVLAGIKLDAKGKLIRLLAGKPEKKGDRFEIDVEIRDGLKEGLEVIHSRARAVLTDNLPKQPQFGWPSEAKPVGQSRPHLHDIQRIYTEILFHGEQLKGLEKITHFWKSGMAARVCPAPLPEKWIKDHLRSRWITDPLVLDTAFQMAIIWSFEKIGSRCLPSFASSYRQYRKRFPRDGVTVLFQERATDQRKLTGDFTIIDDEDRVIAEIKGFEATIDPYLDKAFEKNTRDAA